MIELNLKPCPFCGNDGVMYREQHQGEFGSVVKCNCCGARSMWVKKNFETGCDVVAAEAWNRRWSDQDDHN